MAWRVFKCNQQEERILGHPAKTTFPPVINKFAQSMWQQRESVVQMEDWHRIPIFPKAGKPRREGGFFAAAGLMNTVPTHQLRQGWQSSGKADCTGDGASTHTCFILLSS